MILLDQVDDVDHEHQVRRLEEQLRRFSIIGTPEVLVAGNLEQGYSVDTGRRAVATTTPPPSPCPAPITITFTGIVFDCGCTPFFDGGTGSFIVTSEGNVNSFTNTLNLVTHPSHPCGDCLDGDGHHLFWSQPSFNPALYPHVLISYWNDDLGCPGAPTGIDFTEYVAMALVLLSGTYYLIAWAISSNLMFYGTTTDLSLPIANTLACDTAFTDYSGDPAMDCIFGGSPGTWNNFAHSGTATISV